MAKLRIKMKYDCFEGTYFVVQKRFMLFFWSDISGWFHVIDRANEFIEGATKLERKGVKL